MTDAELLQTLSVVSMWTDEKHEALLELTRRKVSFKLIADAMHVGMPTHCEHGRSIWSTCIACEEIEDQERSLQDDA